MKKIVTIIAILALSQIFGCKKVEHLTYLNTAIVLEKGLDCGETYLIEIESDETSKRRLPNVYYADLLPEEFKIKGLKIQLNYREPTTDEMYICTEMAFYYPHIIVIDAKQVDWKSIYFRWRWTKKICKMADILKKNYFSQ